MCRARGFTMIELVMTVAIIATVAGVGSFMLLRGRPRADLMTSTAELEALLRGARQNALSTGRDTVVMVFPAAQRFVVYEDAAGTFFTSTATKNFGGFDPTKQDGGMSAAIGLDVLIGKLDLPRGVSVGLGGAAAPTLQPPYSAITAAACSFCASSGDRRGAVVFDARGRARFYNGNGAALAVTGGTIALQGSSEMTGYRLLVITGTTGATRAFNHG